MFGVAADLIELLLLSVLLLLFDVFVFVFEVLDASSMSRFPAVVEDIIILDVFDSIGNVEKYR